MTKYDVVWVRSAHSELADIYNRAIDPASVSAAANAIDKTLERDPELRGRDLGRGIYYLVISPLEILYRVFPSERKVRITSVKNVGVSPNGYKAPTA